MNELLTYLASQSLLIRIGAFIGLAACTHMLVVLIRHKAVTMRFVQLENALGATVFIPNRTITNIVSYPRGYVRCIVDITLRGDDEVRQAMEGAALKIMQATHEQFPGILIREPSNEGRVVLNAGKEFLRLKFRIWPNRGQPIESTFLQELTPELRLLDPQYQSWMIAINYEVEEKTVRPRKAWPWGNGLARQK